MKKFLFTCVIAMSCLASHAQDQFAITFNSHTTNYWLALATNLLLAPFSPEDDEDFYFRPSCDFIFPVSVENNAPNSFGEMRGGYTRAFSTPWKRIGDFRVGVGASWDNVNTPFGAYVGLNYKTNEVVFSDDNRNDRTHYFCPELGMKLRFGNGGGFLIETGASYDIAFAYKGKYHDYNKNAVNSGISIDMALGIWAGAASFVIKYTHPTYNYYNKEFTPDNGVSYPFADVNRKMGYISLVGRFAIK